MKRRRILEDLAAIRGGSVLYGVHVPRGFIAPSGLVHGAPKVILSPLVWLFWFDEDRGGWIGGMDYLWFVIDRA